MRGNRHAAQSPPAAGIEREWKNLFWPTAASTGPPKARKWTQILRASSRTGRRREPSRAARAACQSWSVVRGSSLSFSRGDLDSAVSAWASSTNSAAPAFNAFRVGFQKPRDGVVTGIAQGGGGFTAARLQHFQRFLAAGHRIQTSANGWPSAGLSRLKRVPAGFAGTPGAAHCSTGTSLSLIKILGRSRYPDGKTKSRRCKPPKWRGKPLPQRLTM